MIARLAPKYLGWLGVGDGAHFLSFKEILTAQLSYCPTRPPQVLSPHPFFHSRPLFPLILDTSSLLLLRGLAMPGCGY